MQRFEGIWISTVGTMALALVGACGGSAAVEPAETSPQTEQAAQADATQGDEDLSCEAGVLEMDGGQQVVAIASEEHHYLLLLPVAEDWKVDCTGSRTVMEAGSESLAMHLFLHRVEGSGSFDERGMLEQLVGASKEQAATQQGVRFVQEDVLEVEGHLVHESLVEAQDPAGPAHAWSYWTVREGVDGSVLMLNYMWSTRVDDASEQDVLRMRDLMQTVGGTFDILPG